MEEYLITARSVTHAQRMLRLLEQQGVRTAVTRAPMGLTGKGCGYVLRLRGQTRTETALRLLREAGLAPEKVFCRREDGYDEVNYDLF